MDVSGEHRFKAPIELVWETLFDVSAVKASIPGCEVLQETAPDVHTITLRVGVSAVKGRYTGEVRVAEATRPASYRLVMSGSGAQGNFQGEARIVLTAAPGGTVVSYTGDLMAQGPLARLGGPVLSGTAKLLIGQFFKEMERQVRDRAV